MGVPLKPQLVFNLQLPNKPRIGFTERDPQEDIESLYQSLNILAQQVCSGKVSVKFNDSATPADAISLYNNAGILEAKRAIAPTDLARGIYIGIQNLAIGETGEVQLEGLVNYPAGGLIPGSNYWLDTAVAGKLITTAPGIGNRQIVGYAVAVDLFFVFPDKLFI